MMRKTHPFFLTSILLLLVLFLFVQNSDKNPSKTFLTTENLSLLSEVKVLLDQNLPLPSKKEVSESLIH